MSLVTKSRPSDSPFVESVTYGETLRAGDSIRPAEDHWHMVMVKVHGKRHFLVVGPLTTAGQAAWGGDAEILWIQLKLGTFMPHLLPRNLLNTEAMLPEATGDSFWLKGSAWEFPDFENADTFVDRLVRTSVLEYDPAVRTILCGESHDLASRTVRHRLLQATGLSRVQLRQLERARRAQALLMRGTPIADTVFEAGYFDQPHLTRALRHWIGRTPAQILALYRENCQSIQDTAANSEYNTNVLTNG